MASLLINRNARTGQIKNPPVTALTCQTLTGLTNVSTGTGTYSLNPNGPIANQCISMSSQGADISRFDYVLPTPLLFNRGFGVFVNYDALPEAVRYGTPYTALTVYMLPVAGSFANYSTFSISPQYYNGVYGSGPRGWTHILMDYDSIRKAAYMSGVVNFDNPIAQIRLALTSQYPILVSNLHALGYNRPRVTLTFDDGNAEDYTVVFPILQANKFVGNSFIIRSLIGNTYLSVTQLNALYAANWDICCHDDSNDTWVLPTAENGIQAITDFIAGNGWKRAAKIGAAPGGAYNEKLYDILIAKKFNACYRTGPATFSRTNNFESAIADDPAYVIGSNQKLFRYRQYCQTSSSDTSATAIAQLDSAIQSGLDINFGFHKIDAGGTGQGWTTANFTALIAALRLRVDKGLCDVVRVSDTI